MSKSVSKSSSKYNEFHELWTKCRDAVGGNHKIKSNGDTYLPRLSGQDKEDYNKYLQQALFYPASGRTFKAFKGLIFRKEPSVTLPESMSDFQDDVTLTGQSLTDFAQKMVEEEIKTSRYGVLVDFPDTSGSSGMSQAEAEERGIRPFLVGYRAEDIIGDPRTMDIGARTILSKVRLRETFTRQKPDDEFEYEVKERIRVLDLAPSPGNESRLVYRQRVFVKVSDSGSEWIEDTEKQRFPKISGEHITEIPFFITGGLEYREPLILDLVDVNLSHYVAYADHRRGVSFTTRPQPYGTGINEDDLPDPMVLGGGSFWNFPSSEAKIGMLEYAGTGLGASEHILEDLKHMMASVGARLLTPEMPTEQTATEFVIKKQGENSALGDASKRVSATLSDAIRFAARWQGVQQDDDTMGIVLSTDFIPFQAKPEDLTKMIGAVQSGLYTIDDYLWWASQNEMVDPSVDNEERKAQIETTVPAGMGGFGGNGGL